MQPTTIDLIEYETASFERDALSDELAQLIFAEHGKRISVEPPSFRNDHKWQMTSLGWVGFIPLTTELLINLRPKVALRNLFGMLEYAYTLDFTILPGLVECATLEEFYDRLAHLLAQRVLARERQGLYRAYVPRSDSLAYVRGSIDVRRAVSRPWDVQLDCRFEEHTADVEENQILAWTLHRIGRSGLCSERSLPSIRKAWRGMTGAVSLTPVSAAGCTNRTYTRLNYDYKTSHGLCRFFLENSGPTYVSGEHTMFPFLIDMARLYEKFVAAWLEQNLPAHLTLQAQERVHYGHDASAHFRIDLIVAAAATGAPLYVLDTKYKAPSTPATDDVAQVRNYAHTIGCPEAILIYPRPLVEPLDWSRRGIRVRSIAFSLDGNLDQAGQSFLQAMLRA